MIRHISGRRKKQKLFKNNKTLPCVFCHQDLSFNQATLEHITPLSNGGANDKVNLTISCVGCNGERHSVPFEEWKIMWRGVRFMRFLKKSGRVIGNGLGFE